MQLVAYGAQDVYLTGEPQITFFKVVYRRHTNFALESIAQDFNGSVALGKNVTATISRNGDLVAGMHLEVDLTDSTVSSDSYANGIGHMLIETCEVEIGGQKIDKHYGEWLDIWDELTGTAGKRDGNGEMVGKVYQRSVVVDPSGLNVLNVAPRGHTAVQQNSNSSQYGGGADLALTRLYVPLQFWFNRNPGLALPLIALQYHEVKFAIKFRAMEELVVATTTDGAGVDTVSKGTGAGATGDFEAQMFVDYVYLDTEERRRFAQMSHEYLIDQLQFTGTETVAAGASTVRLNFNHPVKELVWTFQADADLANNDMFNYSDCLEEARIQLNGHDRMSTRPASYFTRVQPYYHHTRCPTKAIQVYSFALRPEEHQPSGTCNFSRIDNASLRLQTDAAFAGNINVYAVNYNVLRIVSGMGGLAYSN